MKKLFSFILSFVMLVSVFLTVFNGETTYAALKDLSSVTISAGTVNVAKPAEEISVPISFTNVPETGIVATDMTILYDSSQLEYISAEAGSIVTNPDKNFDINKESDGVLKLLFMDEELLTDSISKDGVFVNLNFKVNNLVSTTYIKVFNPTVADVSLNSIPVKTMDGIINLLGYVTTPPTPTTTPPPTPTATPTPTCFEGFKIVAGNVTAKPNEEISVPIFFENVPPTWIAATDMTILYEPSELEFISAEAGDIVINPEANFASNKVSDGELKLLFMDETQQTEHIHKDGVFVVLKFKVCDCADGLAEIEISKPTAADRSLNIVPIKAVKGSVSVFDINPKDFTISIPDIETIENDIIAVPVNFENIPQKGIYVNSMTINYDSTKLEYLYYEAGSIVPNPSVNFAINKCEDGILKQLFIDESPEELVINADGVLTHLYFKVLGAKGESTSVKIKEAIAADYDIKQINTKLIDGKIDIFGSIVDRFRVYVGCENSFIGDTVSIPVTFSSVPEKGIAATDMTFKYNPDVLEYISYEIGGIVKNPDANFSINDSDEGMITTLFIDMTMENEYITSDGVFVTFNFKVIGSDSELVPVGIIESNFCDIDIKRIEPEIAYGDNINNTEKATVSGYVYSNINTDLQDSLFNEGFCVKLEGTDLFAVTDSKGYFEIKNVPESTYTATITKPNYLKRQLEGICVNASREISKEPLILWCGDIEIKGVQDDAINFEDIMQLCKVFNAVADDDNYIEQLDLNRDGAINMEDIMIIAKHFNSTPLSYQEAF